MVNQLAWLEFAIKAYNHLDLPLQRVFLWLSPYAHTSAWAGLRQAIADLAAQENDGRLEIKNLKRKYLNSSEKKIPFYMLLVSTLTEVYLNLYSDRKTLSFLTN